MPETVCAAVEAYSTVVPAEIFGVVIVGYVVAAEPPSLNVPDVRLSVPIGASWLPPSLKMLFAVTSPIVSVEIVIVPVAFEYVTPALLLLLSVLNVIELPPPVGPKIDCADVPLKLTVLVPEVNVPVLLSSKSPPMFRVPAPENARVPLELIVIDPVTENVPVLMLIVEDPAALPVFAPIPITLPWTVSDRSLTLIV